MKRISSILILCCFLTALSASAYHYDFEEGGIYYKKISDTEVEVTYRDINYNDYSGDVVIPENIVYENKSYSVTSIGDSAFKLSSCLTSVYIPNSVTSIKYYAFEGCNSLISVSIPNSVTSIWHCAFDGCSGLTSIEIPNSVTAIGYSAFEGCSGLTSVKMSTSVTSIESSTFSGCSSLISITIPSSVTSIGSSAFSGCSSLPSLIIPNSIERIGDKAFKDCKGLSTFTLPASVTRIGDCAFDGCIGIKELNIEDGTGILNLGHSNRFYSTCGLFDFCQLEEVYLGRDISYGTDSSDGYSPFWRQSKLSSLRIGLNVTALGENVFKDCSSLTSLIIPNAVMIIDESAFENCKSITSLSVPASVELIGDHAFNGCTGLKELRIEDSEKILSLGSIRTDNEYRDVSLFLNCPLEKLYLGRNIAYDSGDSFYHYSPFYNHTNITELVIGSKVTEIGALAFSGCSGLTSLTVPKSVKKIGYDAFSGCIGLKTIDFYSYNIDGINICGLSSDLPATLKTNSDFSGVSATNLTYFKQLKFQYNNTEYGLVESNIDLNFTNCLFNEEKYYLVSLEDNCRASLSNPNVKTTYKGKEITERLVSDAGFEFMVSPNHKENIFTFYGSPENPVLTRVVSLKSAGKLFDELGLQNIEKVEVLKIDGDFNGTDVMTLNRMTSLKYLDLTNANIIEGGNTYHGNLKTQNSIVGTHFFKDIKLEVLYLPKNAKLIDNSALEDNKNLKIVNIPNAITSIESNAFKSCSSLTSLSIPGSVKSIKQGAFDGCYGIKELYIEDGAGRLSLSWSSKDVGLFHDCPLSFLYLGRDLEYSNPFYSHYSAFDNRTSLKHIVIGDSVSYIVPYCFSFCSALQSVDFGNNVSCIGEDAFYRCESLTSLIFPDSLRKIDGSAFEGCGIKSLKLPDSVERLGRSAFENCTALTSVEISNSITEIVSYVFDGCTELTSVSIPNSVKRIGSYAFNRCESLKSIEIPNSVVELGGFANCISLTSITIPNSVSTIEDNAFEGCSALTSIRIPNSVTEIGGYAFCNCTSLQEAELSDSISEIGNGLFSNTLLLSIKIPSNVVSIGYEAFYGTRLSEVLLPPSVKDIGSQAFAGNTNISKVVSLNTIPPEIDTTAFDAEVEEQATLHVQKGCLVFYWLDPIWKEFANISDDILCLQAIPKATYGDDEIELSQYAPNDVELTYETSNDDVVQINGTKMRIVGAGIATIGALLAEDGIPMEVMGQLRQFEVKKADLTVTVADITVEAGLPLPDFRYVTEGLKYDDTLEDIENLPVAHCDVDENSEEGEYEISFSEGSDRNYNIYTKPAKVIVTHSSISVDDVACDETNQDIEVYLPNGVLIYNGSKLGIRLQQGLYLIRQGNNVKKIVVK